MTAFASKPPWYASILPTRLLVLPAFLCGLLPIWIVASLVRTGLVLYLNPSPVPEAKELFPLATSLFAAEVWILLVVATPGILLSIIRTELLEEAAPRPRELFLDTLFNTLRGGLRLVLLTSCAALMFFFLLHPEKGRRYRNSVISEALFPARAQAVFVPDRVREISRQIRTPDAIREWGDAIAFGQVSAAVLLLGLGFWRGFVILARLEYTAPTHHALMRMMMPRGGGLL